jgi:hypothetical protein
MPSSLEIVTPVAIFPSAPCRNESPDRVTGKRADDKDRQHSRQRQFVPGHHKQTNGEGTSKFLATDELFRREENQRIEMPLRD